MKPQVRGGGFTLPSYNQIVRSNTANSVRNELFRLLNFTRLEAMHRQHIVTVCPLNSHNSCHGHLPFRYEPEDPNFGNKPFSERLTDLCNITRRSEEQLLTVPEGYIELENHLGG
jgi:hypothetical protein